MSRRTISMRCLPAAVGVCLLFLLLPAVASASGEAVPSSPFDLPPGGTVTLTFDVTVDSPLGVCLGQIANQGTFSGANFPNLLTDDPDTGAVNDATATPLDLADLAITKDDGQASAVPGDPIQYTITVTNAGPSPAVGATVADTFPAALTGESWTCTASAGSSCTAGPVADDIDDTVTVLSGGTLTYTVNATVAAGATGSLSNTATVTAPATTIDCNQANNSATDTDTLTPQVDLAITKDDGQASAVPGDPIEYTITVTNTGPSDAVGATVVDVFPATLTGVSWTCTASAGSSCTSGPVLGDINDTVTVLDGGTVTYTATGTIDAAATGSLANTATVSAPGGTTDTNGANDSATDTDTLTPQADLSVTKSDDADPPPAGANLTYTIEVTNLGPSDATAVVVTDNLPAGVTLVATTGCAEDPNGTPTCTLGDLAAGGMASYTVEVSIDPMPPAMLSNTACAAGTEPDPNAANDCATEETTLDAVPPEVDVLDTVGGTGDGELTECETARTTVTSFLVTFSEEVESASAVDPASVTNPDNFRLVSPAPGAGFDTTSCASGTGADTVVAISGVAYDGGSSTATVAVNGGAFLPDGLYRLFVCGTIEDLAGNPLDGGAGVGTDLERGFRVDRENLFADAHFDTYDPACTLAAWSSTSPPDVEVAAPDAGGSPDSGSVHNADPVTGFDLSQCVPLFGGIDHDVTFGARVDTGPSNPVSLAMECDFFDAPACGGAGAGSFSLAGPLFDSGGSFLSFADAFTPGAAVVSGLCGITVSAPLGDPFDVYVDDLSVKAELLIFGDGFESGDTSAWTAVNP